MGLSVTQPRLSWQLTSLKRNVMQTAYAVKATADKASANAGKEVWSSGRVSFSQSVYVTYAGARL